MITIHLHESPRRMREPTIEERLAAAAFTILTDDNVHSTEARRWAVRFLRAAAGGRPTAFQQHLPADTQPKRRVAH